MRCIQQQLSQHCTIEWNCCICCQLYIYTYICSDWPPFQHMQSTNLKLLARAAFKSRIFEHTNDALQAMHMHVMLPQDLTCIQLSTVPIHCV